MTTFAFKYSLKSVSSIRNCSASKFERLAINSKYIDRFCSRSFSCSALRSTNFVLKKLPLLKQTTPINKWKYNLVNPAAFIMSSSPGSSSPRPSSEEVQGDKDTYLSMDLEEKRSRYKCKDNYVTLDKVLTWKEYFAKEKVQPATVQGKKYEVNEVLNSKVSVWEGDITVLEIDSIVNAANNSLLGGGGVDGAIHRAAGPKLLNECRLLNGCPSGHAKISGGYKLPAKYIIHTVGPVGEKPDILRAAYVNSLQLMVDKQLRSTAFPCISTGVYDYPRVQAAHVALSTVREFLENNSDQVDRVIFTVFLEEDKEVYEELMQKYFPLE